MVGGLALGLTGLALAAGSYSIIVNGQVATKPAVVMNGETYVPLSALKGLGITGSVKGNTLTLTQKSAASAAPTAAGGANQITALEGCINQTLFNGIWRVKVVSLSPIHTADPGGPDTPGWAVKLEVRNGTQKTTSLMSTGFGASSGGSQPALVLTDGSTLALNDSDFLKPWSQDVLQGGVNTFTLRFSYPTGTTEAQAQALKPSKFILQINSDLPPYLGVKYSVPDPSLRVQLTCKK
ncbi:hypothetical protein ACFP9V_04865 [Deinococcus radiopugnans]|uniref:Copper amine oxidase N-terminal domain-containing protein n=1 Tax=Deinococcus radiopugnans ATCC 19172 TaxID=585398 RepID=A0A5C4YAK0_9DEIO|nr:hypothetical protein [Deinococcus radiopugnans]MBB6015715.1 hypothetical protein [Deinococcus radiopugnans ATCC 19172]TNM72597.1 hypothetical protein FHR04_01835 [Deinococcus radiopugnans ATCC 19172]